MARAALSIAIAVCGGVILVEMLSNAGRGGFKIVPGLVLGAAMIALGAHRMSLILRARAGQ